MADGNITVSVDRLTQAMILALAAIDAELGLPEDGCNSTQRTLEAIRLLKVEAATVARLLEARNAELRALVAKWRDHWSVQPQGADKESAAMGGGIEHCADELEQWLDGKKPNAKLTGQGGA